MAANSSHECEMLRVGRTRRQFIQDATKCGLALGVGASALAGRRVARAANPGGRLVVALSSNIENLDPQFGGGPSQRVYMFVYETLIWLDHKGKIQPAIAESWRRVDPTRWHLKVRKGIKFHSGRSCDPKAIEASFARFQNPASPHLQYSYSSWIASVKAISDDTIELTTNKPYSSTIDALADVNCCPVLDTEAVRQQGDLKSQPVGTGPFIFDRWEVGKYVRFKRNPNYWGGAPKLDELEFWFIPEATTRMMALQRGEVDLIYEATPEMFQIVANDPKFRLYKYPRNRNVSVEYNFLKPIIKNNPEVRAAISQAIDTVGITKKLIGVVGEPACSLVHRTSRAYGCFGFPDYDPAKAKQTLDAAGWQPGNDGVRQKGGQRLEFDLTTDYTRDYNNREMAEAIQAMLGQVGIKINLTVVQRAPYVDRVVTKGEHDLCIMGRQPVVNPDIALYPNFHSSSQALGSWGTPRTFRKDLDDMLDAARAAETEEEMIKLFREFQRIIHDQHLLIPIYYANHLHISRAYVKEVLEHLDEACGRRYNEVTLDKA